MQQYLKFSLLILTSVLLAFCKQKVEIKIISENLIMEPAIEDFSLANYGLVPYGKTIYSRVRLANPQNGCSQLDTSEDDQYAQILLMRRGDCTFLQKTNQAELSGAKLLLVADSLEETEQEVVIVADRIQLQFFYELFAQDTSVTHIPTIMVEKKIGEQMIEVLQKGDDLVLSVTFPKPDQASIAYVDFWLDSFNKQSYEFLSFAVNSSLSEILSSDVINQFIIAQFVLQAVMFIPHYVIWYCFQCESNDYKDGAWDEVDDFCLSKGRYCNPDPDRSDFYDGPMKGVDVVEEDWRQICIYETYRTEVETNFHQSTWVKYMIQFYNNCILTADPLLKQCGDGVMQALGIKKSVIDKCYNDNIKNKKQNNTIIQNLETQKNKFIEEEIMIWPSLFINNLSYRGDLQSNETLETICVALEDSQQPKECNYYLETSNVIHKRSNSIAWGIVFLILGLIAIFMLLFYYVYKRQIRKEVDKEIQIQVDTRITQYFALQDQKK